MHNSGVVGTVPDPLPEPSRRFFVEIHDEDDVCLAHLEYCLAHLEYARLNRRIQLVNKPSQMTLTYPINDEKASLFVWPNRVWLFERVGLDATGTLVDIFDITNTDKAYSPTNTLTVSLENHMAQLIREKIITLSNGYLVETAVTVFSILTDWLNNYQDDKTNKRIVIGDIDPEIALHTTTLKLPEGVTILAAIKSIQKTTGGFFFVDAQRRLNWKVYGLGASNFHIVTGRDLSLIKERIDNRRRANELYVYGKGANAEDKVVPTGGNPVKGPNWGTDDPDELLRRGEVIANRNSLATITLTIDAIDLRMAENGYLNFQGSFNQIRLGNQVYIHDTESSKEVDAIISKEVDAIITSIIDVPDDPLNVQLIVHDPNQGDPSINYTTPISPKDDYTISDAVAELYKDKEERDGENTGGAGDPDLSWDHITANSPDSLNALSAPGTGYATDASNGGDTRHYYGRSGSDWIAFCYIFVETALSFLPTPEDAALGVVSALGGESKLYFHPGKSAGGAGAAWVLISHMEE